MEMVGSTKKELLEIVRNDNVTLLQQHGQNRNSRINKVLLKDLLGATRNKNFQNRVKFSVTANSTKELLPILKSILLLLLLVHSLSSLGSNDHPYDSTRFNDEVSWAFRIFDIDNSGSIAVEEINDSVQVSISMLMLMMSKGGQ